MQAETLSSIVRVADRPFLILPEAALQPSNEPGPYIQAIVTRDTNGNFGIVEVSPHACLTAAQTRTLVLGAISLSVADTAKRLYNTENTIKTHRRMGLERLGMTDMAEMVSDGFSSGMFTVVRELPPMTPVSPRETEALHLGAELNDQARNALSMNASMNTVKTHRKNLFRKLVVNSMEGAVLLGHMYGILDTEDSQAAPDSQAA